MHRGVAGRYEWLQSAVKWTVCIILSFNLRDMVLRGHGFKMLLLSQFFILIFGRREEEIHKNIYRGLL